MCSIKTAHCGGRAPHSGYLQGSNLPPSHSSMPSILSLLLFLFLLSVWPVGLSILVLQSERLWALTCTTSNFPPSRIFLNFRLPPTGITILLSAVLGSSSSFCSYAVLFSAHGVLFSASLCFSVFLFFLLLLFSSLFLFLCLFRPLWLFLFPPFSFSLFYCWLQFFIFASSASFPCPVSSSLPSVGILPIDQIDTCASETMARRAHGVLQIMVAETTQPHPH